MSIERSQSPLVLQASEPPPNKNRNPADAEKNPGAFAAVMQAQTAPKAAERSEKAKAPDAPPQAETRHTDDKEKVSRSATDDEDEDEDKASSNDDDGTASAQLAAAAALALAAAALLGPVAAKAGAAAKMAADGKAVAGVDAPADGKQAITDTLMADATGRLPAAGLASDAARAALAEGQAGASKLASYASVLEQLQSRLVKGEKAGISGADDALPATGIDTGAAAKAASGVALQNARMDKLMNSLQTGMGIGPSAGTETAKLASLSSEAGGALKVIDRFQGATPRDSAGTTPDGAFAQQNFTSTVQFDGTAVPASASTPATGDAVADQVSYWVSQGIQSAELTLDGQGGERVEVKISMSGNEAHVEFRSDQAATREMLAGTASQLRDLLSGQGVVLSGVTVGHAGGELAGGQQQPQSRSHEGRHPARGTAEQAQAVAAERPAMAAVPAGTLDLFV